eukprot:7897428-Prorocentrum_lima.AAC.1
MSFANMKVGIEKNGRQCTICPQWMMGIGHMQKKSLTVQGLVHCLKSAQFAQRTNYRLWSAPEATTAS